MSQPIENFDFIVNRRAGTVLKKGEDKVRQEILSQFGDKAGTFTYVEGSEIASAVRAWLPKNTGANKALIIGGGDGTVATAAEQVLGSNVTLGVLPLGTQNFVARQLGFSTDFKKAAAQYKAGGSAEIDVGKVNGQHFLVGITIDQNSVAYFEGREDWRNKKPLSALGKGMSAVTGLLASKKDEFSISAGKDGAAQKIKGRFIAITNNSITPRPVKSLPFTAAGLKNIATDIMGRADVSSGKLSLYAFKGGLFRVAGILPGILRGKWDRSKSVKTESATEFTIHGSDDGKEKSFILDGEIKKAQYPLNVSIIPKGLKVFRPQ
jgi:diacylglycerol kinase family enzyme